VGFACPLRSALRVWLPSRRFTPFAPLPTLSHVGGTLGIRPSKLSPLGRHPNVPGRMDPHTVSPTGRPSASDGQHTGRPRFLGFDPPESPWQLNTCLAHLLLDAPLGFSLPGHAGGSLAGISPGLLSRTLAATGRTPNSLHLRVSINLHLASPTQRRDAKRRNNPHRVLAPVRP
jgi:hypothetical protein